MATAPVIQLRPKRHKEWASFTLTLCTPCLQQHVFQYLLRYPALKTPDEKCECPCGHEEPTAKGQEPKAFLSHE